MSKETFDNRFKSWARYFFLVAAVITILPWIFTWHPGLSAFRNTGEIGDTIGGIMGPFVAIGVGALTFLAFWVQFKANEQQKNYLKDQNKKFKFERIETRLFEMIRWHKENVSELSYTTYSTRKEEGKWKPTASHSYNKKVFNLIFTDFQVLHDELILYFEKDINEIYNNVYKNCLLDNELIKSRNIDLKLYAKIDILFTIIFYGLSYSGEKTIRFVFASRYNSEFIEEVILAASIKPSYNSSLIEEWHKYNTLSPREKIEVLRSWKAILQRENKKPTIEDHPKSPTLTKIFSSKYIHYYGGHQFRLAHYFSHLFEVIKYIDNINILVLNSKRDYINLLISQISIYEHLIIFLYSLSIGRSWELEMKNNPTKHNENKIISKYKLFSLVLNDTVFKDIMISKFYPNWQEN